MARTDIGAHQRRTLETLPGGGQRGCTEAMLLTHGFKLQLLVHWCVRGYPRRAPRCQRHVGRLSWSRGGDPGCGWAGAGKRGVTARRLSDGNRTPAKIAESGVVLHFPRRRSLLPGHVGDAVIESWVTRILNNCRPLFETRKCLVSNSAASRGSRTGLRRHSKFASRFRVSPPHIRRGTDQSPKARRATSVVRRRCDGCSASGPTVVKPERGQLGYLFTTMGPALLDRSAGASTAGCKRTIRHISASGVMQQRC